SPTLGLGTNSYTITNTVDCTQQLTLEKVVEGGDAAPSAWTLEATGTGPQPALSGNDAGDGVTGEVAGDVTYALSESGGPAEYVQDGPWQCAVGSADPAPAVDSKVIVPRGVDVTCTVTNVTVDLTLLKYVDGQTTLEPADWSLTAAPSSGVPGL